MLNQNKIKKEMITFLYIKCLQKKNQFRVGIEQTL